MHNRAAETAKAKHAPGIPTGKRLMGDGDARRLYADGQLGGELPYSTKYMRGAPIGPRNATPPREYVAASLGSPGEKIRAKRPNSTVLRPMGHRMWAIGDPKISAFDEKTAASEISPRARPDIYLQWCLTLLEM